jgi:predicted HD phosphohydrolase
LQSLELQGGLFSAEQVKAFEETPYHESALWLRRWDEEAKQAGIAMPSPHTYAALLRQLLVQANAR